ncbi:hypothetical protein AHAS_Ahas13G0299300 [Arachis hypogaea]
MRESGPPPRRGAVLYAIVAIDPRPPPREFHHRRSSAAVHALRSLRLEDCPALSLLLVLAATEASAAIRAAIEAIDLVPIPPFLRP